MNTQDAVEKAKEAAERSGREWRGELDGLSAQVEKLAAEISRMGRSGARSARTSAAQGYGALERTGADLAEGIGREIAHVEDRAASAVRERPVQTLGFAVALGFLIAFLLRR